MPGLTREIEAGRASGNSMAAAWTVLRVSGAVVHDLIVTGHTGPIRNDLLGRAVHAFRTRPFRRLHGRGEIVLFPVSTTSLVRHRAGAGEPLVLLHGIG